MNKAKIEQLIKELDDWESDMLGPRFSWYTPLRRLCDALLEEPEENPS